MIWYIGFIFILIPLSVDIYILIRSPRSDPLYKLHCDFIFYDVAVLVLYIMLIIAKIVLGG